MTTNKIEIIILFIPECKNNTKMNRPIKLDFGTSGGMSLFIPFVMPSVTYEQIRHVFEYKEKFGVIRLIKFIKCTTKNGNNYNMVHIYFKHWYNNPHTTEFQTRIQLEGHLNVVCDSNNHFWKVYPSKYWLDTMYKDTNIIKSMWLELEEVKDKNEIYCNLLKKYRDYHYNDSFEAMFDIDMRELLGCDEKNYYD